MEYNGTVLSPWGGNNLAKVNGTDLHSQGSIDVTITILTKTFVLMMVVIDDLAVEAILGLDFLETYSSTLNIGERLLQIPSCKLSVPVSGNCSKPISFNVMMAETRIVLPYSELEVMAVIPTECMGKPHILEANQMKTAVMAARALVNPAAETVPVRLLNPYSEITTVYEGTKIATLEEVVEPDDVSAVTTTHKSSNSNSSIDLDTTLWNIVSRSGTELDKQQQYDLYSTIS